MVFLRWFGMSCFEISNSVTIVTDPHDGTSLGLERPEVKGDIITISHRHFDHASGKELVLKEGGKVIEESGKWNFEGVQIEGISNVENDERGKNVYFVFETEGFRICHLGDLGYSLAEDRLMSIIPVDILLIPIGGTGGHEGREAVDVVRDIDPSIVIPMHYKIEGLNIRISGKDEFLNLMLEEGWKIRKEGDVVIESLPESKEVIELNCRTLR